MNRHEALEVIGDLVRATEHYHPDGSDGSALTPGQDWELTHILYAEDSPHVRRRQPSWLLSVLWFYLP